MSLFLSCFLFGVQSEVNQVYLPVLFKDVFDSKQLFYINSDSSDTLVVRLIHPSMTFRIFALRKNNLHEFQTDGGQ
jgi:hypothetical protein